MSSQRRSLADQIADLDEPAPKDIDPEDELHAYIDDASDPSAARDHYIDVGPSSLRRLAAADSLADPKYDGVRTSRQELMQSDDDEEDEDASLADGEEDGESRRDSDASAPSPQRTASPPPLPQPKRKARDADADSDAADEADALSTTLRQKRAEDRRKGQAVTRQLTLWDGLLDARIRLHKSVSAANRLPAPRDAPAFLADESCLAAAHALLDTALGLSADIALLREKLLVAQGVSVPDRPVKRRRTDAADGGGSGEGARRYEDELRDASEWASTLEHAHHAHMTHTLSKWSAKIAAVAPAVAADRNAFTQSRARARNQNVPAQVEETLANDGARLVARTRTRSVQRLRADPNDKDADGGDDEEAGDVEDVETFDDADFYQQLLRDVIDGRGAADANGGGGGPDEWVLAQRRRKAKKKVDTRASKGRKLRYEVHEKLQNFMVPVPLADGGGWHDAQVDELFASLLGRGFEHAQHAQHTPMDEDGGRDNDPPPVEIGGEMLKGLRVFG